jgi:transposase
LTAKWGTLSDLDPGEYEVRLQRSDGVFRWFLFRIEPLRDEVSEVVRWNPAHQKIRLMLDNHSAHISKETRSYLDTVSQRFEFVFTPKHGSCLNLIENQFSKMTRTMLRGIRVASKQELIDRIHQYFQEINADPVVFRWKYKMDETFIR